MSDFLELTLKDNQKIVVNIHSIQSIVNDGDGVVVGFLEGHLKAIEVLESYEEIKYKLIPSSKPKEPTQCRVARGVNAR